MFHRKLGFLEVIGRQDHGRGRFSQAVGVEGAVGSVEGRIDAELEVVLGFGEDKAGGHDEFKFLAFVLFLEAIFLLELRGTFFLWIGFDTDGRVGPVSDLAGLVSHFD